MVSPALLGLAAAGIAAGMIGGGTLANDVVTNSAYKTDGQIYDPPEHTTVILPTLNEEAYISRALSSLMYGQNVVRKAPDRFDFIVVDSGSTDQTVSIAKEFGAYVIDAPLGKLSARDLAIREARGDVVFSVDADTEYPPNVLNLMLQHFQRPEVVGVYSPRMHHYPFLWHSFEGIYEAFAVPPRFFGSNDAMRRDVYLKMGGFPLGIDQKDVDAMVYHEESNFLDRLRAQGEVVYERYAPVFTSPRRVVNESNSWDAEREAKTRFSDAGSQFKMVTPAQASEQIAILQKMFMIPELHIVYGSRECPETLACYSYETKTLYFSTPADEPIRRYVMGHEVGHAISDFYGREFTSKTYEQHEAFARRFESIMMDSGDQLLSFVCDSCYDPDTRLYMNDYGDLVCAHCNWVFRVHM